MPKIPLHERTAEEPFEPKPAPLAEVIAFPDGYEWGRYQIHEWTPGLAMTVEQRFGGKVVCWIGNVQLVTNWGGGVQGPRMVVGVAEDGELLCETAFDYDLEPNWLPIIGLGSLREVEHHAKVLAYYGRQMVTVLQQDYMDALPELVVKVRRIGRDKLREVAFGAIQGWNETAHPDEPAGAEAGATALRGLAFQLLLLNESIIAELQNPDSVRQPGEPLEGSN